MAGIDTGLADSLKSRSKENSEKQEAVRQAINSKLWDDESGLYYSYDARGNHLLKTPTVSSLMPLLGGIADTEQVSALLEHLRNPNEFWTEVPVPSTSKASPAFNPVRYWSGPSWPVTNWLVLEGLNEREATALHDSLIPSTVGMIAEGVSIEEACRAAARVLELNSIGEEYTTPSRKQYAHAWLWDSAIVAVSWPLVEQKPEPYAPGEEPHPGFWEYYHPHTGEPLGARLMSWTASLFLELAHLSRNRE
jgi:glycogen debranching enzyme